MLSTGTVGSTGFCETASGSLLLGFIGRLGCKASNWALIWFSILTCSSSSKISSLRLGFVAVVCPTIMSFRSSFPFPLSLNQTKRVSAIYIYMERERERGRNDNGIGELRKWCSNMMWKPGALKPRASYVWFVTSQGCVI